MNKSKRLLTAAGFTAILAAASAMPVWAEETKHGWQMEDEHWVYLDSNGERLTDYWKKEADGTFYYLDHDGYMVTNTIIKDGDAVYYVDENGVRVRNRWVSEPNEGNICDQDVDVLWYYFGKDGKAITKEGKSLKLKEGTAEHTYFFDGDGHMLSGWQEIINKKGDNYDTYYLGDENQGFVHKMWQYLEPPEELLKGSDYDYDSYEMFYFGYDGKMTKNSESELENEHFLFDENGVLMKGWQPGIIPHDPDFGVNRYYDEDTGIRAKEWIYAHDPDDEDSDPHWFYCEKNNGYMYNEGGKDSDDEIAQKRINGDTYFFDSHGHMITGLISTGGASLAGISFMEDEYATLSGDIGKDSFKKAAGIYYLSQEEKTLGQLQTNKRLRLDDGCDEYYFYLNNKGRAYQNALVKGYIYGENGAMLHGENDWEAITLPQNIFDAKDYDGDGRLKSGAEPEIEAGTQIIVSKSGKVKKSGSNVKVNGDTYDIYDYEAVQR